MKSQHVRFTGQTLTMLGLHGGKSIMTGLHSRRIIYFRSTQNTSLLRHGYTANKASCVRVALQKSQQHSVWPRP